METSDTDGEMETVAGGLPLPIPEGPFFDVLSRLSIKDLHRHTCLSSWRDYFINFPDSRKKLPQTLQGFFYIGDEYKRHGHGGGGDGDDVDDDGNGGGAGTPGDGGSGNSNSDNGSTSTGGSDDTDKDGDGSSKSSGGGGDTSEDGDGSGDGNDDTEEGGDGSGNSNGNYGLHFLDLLAKSMPIPDDIDTELSFLQNDVGSSIDLLCSCNGLLLFGCTTDGSENYHSLGYIVCNPATKQWVRVPSSGWVLPDDEERDEEFESTFLFFDPAVPSRFLLIQFWHDDDAALDLIGYKGGVHIYSSETGKWSDRSSEWKQFAKGGEWGDEYGVIVRSCMGSSFVNGMLHFFVQRMKKNDVLIVAMDGEGSVCRIIHWPLDMFSKAVFIGQSQGCLHCIRASFIHENEDRRNRIIMSVDVLQDYDAEEWTGKLGIWGSDLSGGEECKREDYEVVAFHPDGNLVYIVDHKKGALMQYDMGGNYPENDQVLRLCTLGHSFGAVTPYVPYFSRSPALEARDNAA